MANNRIGCSSGKTKLIDPNNFYGQSSSNNMSVPLEDLTISVQLSTNKKGRTVLSSNNGVKTTQNSNSVRVTFIEGTEVNGQKVLTSKFTDLTTVFDKDTPNSSSENLGITNIDIDFNSSYAPMITINFIDLRGSSIFQNESQLNNSENKYSVFFQLPYPLYELTIKGYYGKPVKYCLHMTKFNSKFNSQTGNFEITANFIGYTYAMLSDMLLGILKAIPYTNKGKELYKDIKTLNLNDLMIKIGQIDSNLSKIGASDPDAAKLKKIDSMLDSIDLIKNKINILGQSIDYNTDLSGEEAYSYIAIKISDESSDDFKTKTEGKKSYNEAVSNAIKDFNSNNKDTPICQNINESDYSTSGNTKIKTYTKKNFSTPDDITNKVVDRQSLIGYVNFVIWDMTPLFSDLNTKKLNLETEKKNTQLKLGNIIKNNITTALSFQPTVRNIVNVFTNAVEVFLSVIHSVSTDAETHPERDLQLKKAFKNNGNSDLKNFVKYYPWPDYRDNDAQNGYVEKYLGSPGVLENHKLVDELLFIDDLYNAFLTAKKISDEALLEQQRSNLWIPTNPFDTKIYNTKEPYERLSDNASGDDIIEYILTRMFTFMGYTHDPRLIDSKVIKIMAEAEANGLVRSKKLNANAKSNVKTAFLNINTLLTNAKTKNIIEEKDSKYRYINIFFNNPIKVLPLSGPFKKSEWDSDLTALNDKYKNDGSIFLTNYTRKDNSADKELDGGKYIDIISLSKYENGYGKGIADPVGEITDIIKYSELKDKKGYNLFNGIYGKQEFKNMDYDDLTNGLRSNMKNSPLSYIFYRYTASGTFYGGSSIYQINTTDDTYFTTNCLTYGRNNNATNVYDLYLNGSINNNIKTSYYYYDFKLDSSDYLIQNAPSLNNPYFLTLTDNQKISYPYIETPVIINDNKTISISLFGSKLYYNQNSEESKAFLFLNTLPFNGYPFVENLVNQNEDVIYKLFSQTGGFIYAPRLWCAWVGSLIWRSGMYSEYTNTTWTDPIDYPTFGNHSMYSKPTRYQYLTVLKGDKINDNNNEYYSEIFKKLPKQILDSFYNIFYKFVYREDEGYVSWDVIKSELELINIKKINSDLTDYVKTYENFKNIIDGMFNNLYASNVDNYKVDKNLLSKFSNLPNYSIITPIANFAKNQDPDLFYNDSLFLELKSGMENQAVENIVNALRQQVVIVNSGFGVWNKYPDSDRILGTDRQDIVVEKSLIKSYLEIMKPIILDIDTNDAETKRQNKQEVFGTDSDVIIKLQLYRTCKNVYDKWVSNAIDGNNVIFQCGGKKPIRHTTDTHMATKRGSDTPKLIDSFRFVTRSFRDIGDDFFVDPRPIGTYLTDNPNSSFYDAITNLLAANNFDFIALPSFINYNDKKSLESIFDTYTYEEAIEDGICGPSFVCVYIGQKSKHLDFQGSEYENDGFDIQCLPSGKMKETLPKDFTKTSEKYENDVAVFKVAYSQQNQNIFKDIILDQSEFTETEESLKIIDDISKTGSENQRHFGGQNLYSVYGVRSYKTEVEMMGNAMIQPMMYFQLDNIPMFHGAYLITHVKHSIKPNFMSTNFTGVRVRHPETPILDAAELYMSLIQNIQITATNTTASARRAQSVSELVPLISKNAFGTNKDKKYIQY